MKSISKFLPLVAAVSLSVFAADEEPQPGQSTQQNRFEELVITSSRIEQPLRQVATAMTVITREDLDLKGYSSLADVLRTETSIGVSNNGGAGKATALRIRGEEGYRTLVMIDGIDMADPTGTQIGPQIQHIMNTYDIERVEVLRGPQGFMYGADAGGVVNVITRTGSQGLAGGFSAEAGAQGAQNLGGNVAFGNESLDMSLSISDHSTDGFNSRSDDTVLQDDDGSDNRTIHIKTGWNMADDLRATFVYRDIDAVYDFDSCGFGASDDCVGVSEQKTAKLNLQYQQGSYTHNLSYANTDVERGTFTDAIAANSSEGKTVEIEYLGSYEFAQSQNLIFGADYEEDEITAIGSEGERDQLGLFVEYQHSINDALFLTGGIRHDDNSDFGVHNSYRFSAAYVSELAAGNTLKYRATYGTGFRSPSLYEVAYNAGPFGNDVELEEDSSRGFDLGIDYLLQNGALLQVTYFDQRIEDDVFFDLVTFSGYLQEAGEISSTGIETSIEYPLNPSLWLKANYSFNDTDSNTKFTRSRRPEHLANLGLNMTAFDDRLSVLANLRVSRDAYNDIFGIGLVELDDYEVLDLSAVYRLQSGMEIFGRVQNLTDEDYQEVTDYNTQDRTLSAGVRYSF